LVRMLADIAVVEPQATGIVGAKVEDFAQFGKIILCFVLIIARSEARVARLVLWSEYHQ